MKFDIKNYRHLTWLLIGVTLFFRLWLASWLGLGVGEAYYVRGALDLQLSYFDQPPLFFWLSGLLVKLFGASNIVLRLPAVLLFAGTTWLMFLSGRKLYNHATGFWAALLLNISLIFSVGVGSWYQPDAPLMFFWMLSVYLIINILFSDDKENNHNQLWIFTGISAGLATLSKYHAAFLIAGVLIFVLISKEHRHWLRRPGPYIAVVLLILFAMPVVVWNMQNDWVSFAFQGARAGSSEFRIRFNWFFRSIVGQAIWITPWIWLPLIWQLFRTFNLKQAKRKEMFIFSMAVLPIAFFTIITLWANTQFHFHWQAPGYMMLFMPLGFVITKYIDANRRKRIIVKTWITASVVLNAGLMALLAIHINTGFLKYNGPQFIQKALTENFDPTMELVDYDAIKERFEEEGWLKNDNIFVGTTKWWQCGKIDWALKAQKPMIIFHHDARNYMFLSYPEQLLGKDAIIIALKEDKNIQKYVKPFFDEVEKRSKIDIKRDNEVEISYFVFYCSNFKIPEKPVDVYLYDKLVGDWF